nr:uncharacterized protein LOC111417357 isoform X1 [Onthophagus taurus]
MVETLIFESPVQEEPEPSPIPENPTPFPEDLDQTIDEREKVRVSFFQQSKPQEVDLPDEPVILETEYMMAVATAMNDSNHISYNRQESTDSGWDNPFRPGGDLSREADEIVQLIKGGKPITPTSGGGSSPIPPHFTDQIDHGSTNNTHSTTPITESPKKASPLNATPATALNSSAPPKTNSTANATNGAALQNDSKPGGGPAALDVQRGTIAAQTPSDANQVEHVVIKKKPKCKCCVIQ